MNDRSARPSDPMFWMMVSTLISASASAVKMLAATPGWSWTPVIVILASSLLCAMPDTIACSISGVSLVIQVPSSVTNDERTCSGTS